MQRYYKKTTKNSSEIIYSGKTFKRKEYIREQIKFVTIHVIFKKKYGIHQ